MEAQELKMLRQLLFLQVVEAAKFIGKCSPRTWQLWEKGWRIIKGETIEVQVPIDVAEQMQFLALTRQERLEGMSVENSFNCNYFESFNDFVEAGGPKNVLMWRLAQSVAAAIVTEEAAKKGQKEETIE